MDIKKIPLGEIKPYFNNPRVNEGAIEAVAESIRRYGFNQPIVLDKDNIIIVGHTRHLALQRLGMVEADCLIVDLPADKAREYRIADNRTNEFSDWDMEKLVAEMKQIDDTSFIDSFLADMNIPIIAVPENYLSDVDPTPKPKPVWVLIATDTVGAALLEHYCAEKIPAAEFERSDYGSKAR